MRSLKLTVAAAVLSAFVAGPVLAQGMENTEAAPAPAANAPAEASSHAAKGSATEMTGTHKRSTHKRHGKHKNRSMEPAGGAPATSGSSAPAEGEQK